MVPLGSSNLASPAVDFSNNRDLNLQERDSSIHNIPKQDTVDTAEYQNLQQFLDESQLQDNQEPTQHTREALLDFENKLNANDSKESLIKSLELIHFPQSSSRNSVQPS
jgi:tRNA(Ile)-lysidine synthase TilS/MesJ